MSSRTANQLTSPLRQNLIARWQLLILVSLALVRGLIYLSIFPPWVAPDEPAHFEAVRIIGQEGQMPTQAYYQATPVNSELSQSFQTFRMWELLERPTPTQQLRDQTSDSSSFIYYPYPGKLVYADTHPILPHILLSPISNMAASFDIATELYLLRGVSVGFAMLLVVISWLVCRRAFPNQPQFWLAIPAFVVFLPMHTHIFASLNTDTFATLLASGLLLVLISFFDKGFSKPRLGLLIGLLILALFIKRTVVFTLLWAGVAGVLYLGYYYRWSLKRVAQIGAITAGILAVALVGVIANARFLADSFIALFNMNIGNDLSFAYVKHLSWPEIGVTYIKSGLFAFITFWGDFGGANINIPWGWAYALMIFCGLVGVGVVIYIINAFQHADPHSRYHLYILLTFTTGIVLSLTNAFFPVLAAGPTWGPPARYFFPAIIPVAAFFYLGVWQLFPAKYRRAYLLPLWLMALAGYDALVITKVLLPYLYG